MFEVVANGRMFNRMGPRSLLLDSRDQARLAYGQDHLYYRVECSGTWGVSTADPSFGVGERTAQALQADGHPASATSTPRTAC